MAKAEKQYIKIRGANEHNLKNLDVDIPRNEFVVLTGLSGSGKSSLAFDTIYAEGQRRYMESLSSYARQFLGQMEKPDVEKIEGLSPAISIDQKSTNRNPRSTVGTVTEIYDYFRLLYARIGIPHCPVCGKEIKKQSVDQMVGRCVVVAVEVAVLIVDVDIEGIVEVPALNEYHLSHGGIGKGGVCLFRIGQTHAFDYRLAARVLVVGT